MKAIVFRDSPIAPKTQMPLATKDDKPASMRDESAAIERAVATVGMAINLAVPTHAKAPHVNVGHARNISQITYVYPGASETIRDAAPAGAPIGRPDHLNYLGDHNLVFSGLMVGVEVYFDMYLKTGIFFRRSSTIVTREDFLLLRDELTQRGIPFEISQGWR